MKRITPMFRCPAVLLLILLSGLMISSCGTTRMVQSTTSSGFRDYTVENAGVGRDGTYLLKVITHSSQPDSNLEMTEKNAVHAVLFKGIPAGGGFSATSPLAGSASAESAHSSFFSNFFLSDYRQYVKSVARNSIEIVRQKDKSYKTAAVVSIKKDDLRHHLENNAIISKMSK